LVDGLGRLVAFVVTPGQRGDAPVAADLIWALPASASLAADRAYDSDVLRALLLALGTRAIIPNGPLRKRLHPVDPSPKNEGTSSSAPSAASGTSDASPRDTTSSSAPTGQQ